MCPLGDSGVQIGAPPGELAGRTRLQGDVGEAATCVKEGNAAAVQAWGAVATVGTLEVQVSVAGSGRATG